MKKKGSITDIMIVFVFMFAFAVIVLIGFKINDAITEKFAENPITSANADVNHTFQQTNGMFPSVIDSSFLFLAVGLSIIAIAFAAMVKIHPVFFVFYIIALSFVIFICGISTSVYREIADQPEFADLADELTFTNLIMSYLPLFVTFFGVIIAALMYKTYSTQQWD